MASPYETVTVTGYNANPPPDDGTESEENRVLWETIKEKLPDPLKTAIEAIDTNLLAAFLKVIGGGGVTSSAISATIGASDQGKLYRATGAGITITTPDATSVGSPFVVGFVNNAAGSVTLDGSGAQTVNGAASITIPPAGGGMLFTDGSNWFYSGVSVAPVGPGQILNGTIAESNATNAATFALKTLAGADPSAGDPVFACFRNATPGTGNYVFRAVTAALSLTIPSGATLGAANATSFDVSVVLFDDAGTVRLGVVNATNLALAKSPPIASSTAIGTGSDSANVFYTGTGVTSKPYIPLAVARYSGGPGLATAGAWNVSPTTLQLHGPDAPAPCGPTRQVFLSGTAATYTTPTGARQLRIRMIGGGGGGGGDTANTGATGTASIFNSIEAAPGAGGASNGGTPGLGGTGGAGTASLRVAGSDGFSQSTDSRGGRGASGFLGGGGVFGKAAGTGKSGVANTGSGGAGGSDGAGNSGTGGAAGEYVELIVMAPAATYTYTVGAGGAGGAAGTTAGGDGGSGIIVVDEFY